jgi:hypothetical protein
MDLCSKETADVLIVWEEHAMMVITGFTYLTLKLYSMSAAKRHGTIL